MLSGMLAPVQGLLEILSNIPGLGHLAGKGADKIQELRNFLTGADNIAATKQNKILQTVETKVEEPPTSEPDRLMAEYGADLPGGEKNKLRGVLDISGGAAALPSFDGASAGTASSGAGAGATPGANTAAILATVTGIAALLKSIDGNVTAITSRTATAIGAADLPSIGSPPTATITGGHRLAGNAEGTDSARNIAPVSQGERIAYSLIERRETLAVEVSAARGSEARIIRAPRDIDIELINLGGNS